MVCEKKNGKENTPKEGKASGRRKILPCLVGTYNSEAVMGEKYCNRAGTGGQTERERGERKRESERDMQEEKQGGNE